MSLYGRFRLPASTTFAITLALATFVTPVAAQWVSRGLTDPIVRTLSVFSNSPTTGSNTLAVATLGGGYFQGVDNGSTIAWTRLNSGLPTTRLRAMRAVSQSSIYVVTDTYGVYVTANGGTSWTASNGSGATSLACRRTRAITIPGGATSTIYVGTHCEQWSGVYKSTDGGGTWTRLGTSVFPGDTDASTIQTNNTGTVVYAATSNYGIFKSTDSGANWTVANAGIATPNPRTLNVQFVGSGTSTLLTYVEGEGVYKSTNSAASWTLSSSGLPAGSAALAGIQKDGITGTTFYIGIDGAGIYRSTDSGSSWSLWGSSSTADKTRFARTVATDTATAGKYYIGAYSGVTQTADNGSSFTDYAVRMGFGTVNSILHDVESQNTTYMVGATISRVSNFYAPVYDSTVRTRLDTGITGTTIYGMLVQDAANPSVMYVTTNNKGVFKSTDKGDTWSASNSGLPSMIGQPGQIALDPTNSQVLYLGSTNDLGIYKSVNAGTTWAASSTGLATVRSKAVYWIAIHPITSTLLFAATDDGLYKSVDAGAHWTAAYTALDSDGSLLPVSRVHFNPANPSEVYIGTDHRNADGTILASSGVLRTTNGGASWTQVLSGKRAKVLEILPNGSIIVGLAEVAGQPALLGSNNGGAGWASISGGLAGSDARAIGVHASRSLYLTLSLEDGFYVTETPLLAISRTGTGSGRVTSSPAGIDCGSTCSAIFALGQSVTLTAAPATGSSFAGWSGTGCTGSGICTVTMDRARSPTATFSTGTLPGSLSTSPTSVDFGGQSMNTTAPVQLMTITNGGGGSVTVTSLSVSTYFTVAHNCATLAAGASCTATITFTPTASGTLSGTLTLVASSGTQSVPLAGTGEKSLVTHYYRSILRRAPDAGGKAYWNAEAARVQALGVNVNEVWFAMAGSFFFSTEYVAFGRTDTEYVTDLFNTFFNRAPDLTGLAYWVGQVSQGMPREVVLVSFMFSQEFASFTQAIFGTTVTRKEIDTVVDFYRGLLARLPDDGGFNFWIQQFRAAQCQGAAAVSTQAESISSQFAQSGEYAARNRTNAQYVGDLYNAFLRRGGDLGGVLFWINQIATGAQSREAVRQQFMASSEFNSRVNAIIAQGCLQ